MNKLNRLLLALICALTFISARLAQAAVFNIGSGDIAGLKAAITTANSNGVADTINLAANGTYTLSGIDNSVDGAIGLPEIKNDVAGLDLTINGNGATIQRSTAAGTPEFRILHVSNLASVSCVGLTIANGKLSGNSNPASAGGGIYVFKAELLLSGCTLRSNAATLGGALNNDGGSLTLDACTVGANTGVSGPGIRNGGTAVITNADITENTGAATGNGGGIANYGTLALTDSRMNLNTSGVGAGIFNEGSATVQRCALNDNTAGEYGGGAYNNVGTLTVESSTLNGNKAGLAGGAVCSVATAILQNSTVSNSRAPDGGAFYNGIGGALALLNCTVSGNVATQLGGALHNSGGSAQIRCATFAFNSAAGGHAIYNTNPALGSAQVTLRNSIFHSSTVGLIFFNASGVITSEGHNLSTDGAGGNAGAGPGGHLNQPSDLRNAGAGLGPLQDNGGLTFTHALLPTSQAIDKGDDAMLAAPFGLTSDQRGVGFPRYRGAHVDIGAVEVGIAVNVTTVDDHDDGDCTLADCTLREAIRTVNMAGGGNISFAPGVTGTIQLSDMLPTFSASMALDGPGPDLLAVRRDSGGDYRIFTITNATIFGPSVRISGLTITNGRPEAGPFPSSSGGGILNDRGSLTVENCAVVGNSGALSGETYGGGIFNSDGSVVVSDTVVQGNTAFSGGGLASRRTTVGTAVTGVRNSTFSGNSALGGFGGGFFQEATNTGSIGEAFLLNSTFSGNSASPMGFSGGGGGGIYNGGFTGSQARAEVRECTLSGNNAPAGAGVYNLNFSASASVALSNTILKTGTLGENLINSSGIIQSLGHNLCSDAAGTFDNGTGPGGYLTGTADRRNTDPLLGPLKDNGGATFTHALLPGSPAINGGEDTSESEFDQRGFARVGTNDIGSFEFGAERAVPLLSVVSRKSHGTAGTYDVNFPLSGNLGVECRSGGASGGFQLVFKFANPLTSVDAAALTAGVGEVGQSSGIGADPHEYVVNLTGVTDAQFIRTTLTNVLDADGNFSPSVAIYAGFLLGDANGDAVVNAADAVVARNSSGQTADATNFRADFNRDGSINSADATTARARSGNAIESRAARRILR
ncbi:MAG: choice-of-anchor Q domain-containing protein [Chthoniobacterales bacterium]